MSNKYILRFDGCSKGNPGPAGAGAVLYEDEKEMWSGHHFVGKKETNNVAEYNGLILGLREAVSQNINCLHVEGDSLLVIKQMRGEYKVKSENLFSLYEEAKKLEKKITTVTYQHIPRNKNAVADKLSNDALKLNS
jgi:ribonuclease HI